MACYGDSFTFFMEGGTKHYGNHWSKTSLTLCNKLSNLMSETLHIQRHVRYSGFCLRLTDDLDVIIAI
jgi:hypothetical protein